MTCRELIDFIGRYLEGDLSAQQRSTFDAHLAQCPACVHYLDTYHETVRLARDAFDASAESLPADVPEDLVRAIVAARSK